MMDLLGSSARCPQPFVKSTARIGRGSWSRLPHCTPFTSLAKQRECRRRVCLRAQGDKVTDTEVNREEESLPPWIISERERELAAKEGADLPFPIYLIGSALVAIAAVGSIFEYFNRHAIFGVLPPDNILWAPILGFFAITGLPSSGYLFIRAINAANREAETQDRIDGY